MPLLAAETLIRSNALQPHRFPPLACSRETDGFNPEAWRNLIASQHFEEVSRSNAPVTEDGRSKVEGRERRAQILPYLLKRTPTNGCRRDTLGLTTVGLTTSNQIALSLG